jgi:hypothetical protein
MEIGMPMRGELVMPATWKRGEDEDASAWAVISVCAIAAAVALCFAATTNDLAALIMQYNVF